VSGSRPAFAGFVAGCCLLTSAAALAATPRTTVNVAANCAGDTVTARVTVATPRRTQLTLRLLERKTAQKPWIAIGRSRRFKSTRGTHSYRFRFDISPYAAYAYRVRLTRPQQSTYSDPVLAASCAPGRQVPEAPLAILLPLSLLATSSLLLVRRRRLN
jgi:hypothetical protein